MHRRSGSRRFVSRQALAAAGAALVAATSLAACGGGGSAGSGGDAITIWTITQPSSAQQVVENLISKFNKTYPGGGHVSIDWIGGEPYKQKIAVAMAGHRPPAIFLTYGGQLFQQYVNAGDVADLTSALSSDPAWKAQYAAKNVFGLATFNNKIYGIPESGPDYELMWENKAVLDAAGATSAPSTWDAFQRDIAAVQKAGKAPIALAGKDLWPEMIWLQYLTLRYGGTAPFDKIAALKTDAWSDPAVVKAANTVAQLAKSGAFAKGFNTVTFDGGQADQLLSSGQAAFQAQLYYDSANMRVYNPTFAGSADYVPFNFPSVPGGTGDPNQLVGQAAEYFGVSSHLSASAKKEALAWLKFETTSDAYNLQFLADRGYSPITPSAAQKLSSGQVPDGTLLKKLYDIGTSAPSFQPYWDQDLPSAVITPMLTNIGELFDQTMSPQQFVSAMNTVMAQNQK
jgi:raffinose/stachyose/melibiose transport system substrate-binding protein